LRALLTPAGPRKTRNYTLLQSTWKTRKWVFSDLAETEYPRLRENRSAGPEKLENPVFTPVSAESAINAENRLVPENPLHYAD
jgi:hypothetical protein